MLKSYVIIIRIIIFKYPFKTFESKNLHQFINATHILIILFLLNLKKLCNRQ